MSSLSCISARTVAHLLHTCTFEVQDPLSKHRRGFPRHLFVRSESKQALLDKHAILVTVLHFERLDNEDHMTTTLANTSQLWYPGRVPLCTNELLWLLTQLAENLHKLSKTRDGTYLGIIDTIVGDAIHVLSEESASCLHTDETIKSLVEFLNTTCQASHLLYDKRSEEGLVNLVVTTVALRDELRDELEKTTALSATKTQEE